MTESSPSELRRAHTTLLASVFFVSVCGLVYELLAGALSSYLVGDSVLQFSVQANRLSSFLEDRLYTDDIILSTNSAYQRMVVTRNGSNVRMYINGSIQFDSRDEYRYHESLVHPAITRLFREHHVLRGLNRDALRDPRVEIVNADAWKFLEKTSELYDVAILDFPDPHDLSLSRLYSRSFYRLLL